MRIYLSHTRGYRFVPCWTIADTLAFTTVNNTVFRANRTENAVIWHMNTSRRIYQGTEQDLYAHIKQENNNKLYTCVMFSRQGNAYFAHFTTRMRRDLFLCDCKDQLDITEAATFGFFSSIPSANRALAVIPSTMPFIELTHRFPNDPYATILYVQTPAQKFFLSFGRTKKHRSQVVSVPATFWNIEVALGIGKPWLILQKRTVSGYKEQMINSEQELAEQTGWYVERIQ